MESNSSQGFTRVFVRGRRASGGPLFYLGRRCFGPCVRPLNLYWRLQKRRDSRQVLRKAASNIRPHLSTPPGLDSLGLWAVRTPPSPPKHSHHTADRQPLQTHIDLNLKWTFGVYGCPFRNLMHKHKIVYVFQINIFTPLPERLDLLGVFRNRTAHTNS